MWGWSLLLVPGALALVMGLLVAVAWLEQRILSPQALIWWAVKARNTPEHAERVVRAQGERLLSQRQRHRPA